MTELAARLGALTNATHGFIYFSPEAASEYEALGLAPHQQYFASRAAAMGPVGPEMVDATFFNFCPSVVRRAVPSCWDVATPVDLQQARMRAAGRVLGSVCSNVEAHDVAEATKLLSAMVGIAGHQGKPLAAANSAVELHDDPWIKLWQLLTIVREWRGDAHVAVLTAHAVEPVEALVLHAATGKVPKDVLIATRGWPDDAWTSAVASLAAHRRFVDSDGAFTDQGRQFRKDIETQTNVACQPLVDSIGPKATERLCELITPIRDALIAAGAFAKLNNT